MTFWSFHIPFLDFIPTIQTHSSENKSRSVLPIRGVQTFRSICKEKSQLERVHQVQHLILINAAARGKGGLENLTREATGSEFGFAALHATLLSAIRLIKYCAIFASIDSVNAEGVREKERVFRMACGRPQGGGVKLMWTNMDRRRASNPRFSCGRHKWMAP